MEWLTIAYDLRKRNDQILPNHNTFTHRFVAWRELNHDMGFWRGKQDILRHSYWAHRMPMVRNAHQVAEEMGNSMSDRAAALRRCSGAVKSGCLVADYAQEGVQHLADTSGRLICVASRSAFSARVGFPIGLQSIALIRAYQKETPPVLG